MTSVKDVFIKSLCKLDLLQYLNLSSRISINGAKYRIPLLGGLGLNNLSSYESWMTGILSQVLSENKSFLDIGANVGQTLLRVKSMLQNIDYYGFEPNPACIYYLRKLTALNQLSNITILPVAIAESTRVAKLFFAENDVDPAASIVEGFRKINGNGQESHIAVFAFKDIIRSIEIDNIGVIKIDVEGAELDVLRNLVEIIREQRPYILIEILPVYQSRNKKRLDKQESIESLLKNLNYSIFRIIKQSNNNFKRLEKINSIGIHGDLSWCDYLLVPSEIESNFY